MLLRREVIEGQKLGELGGQGEGKRDERRKREWIKGITNKACKLVSA